MPWSQIIVGGLYAAFASYAERGERKYWLLQAKSKGRTGETIKVPGGRTIACNQWFIEAYWYLSTSDDQGRKSYKIWPELAHLPVASLVQEHGLEWQHEGRNGGDSILAEQSHLALMSHNFSNVE